MTTEPVPADLDARLHAIHTLGFDHSVNSLDRMTCLRLITKSQYVLSSNDVDALQILVNPTAVANREDMVAGFGREERATRGEQSTAAFAHSFFDLPTDERHRQWNSLMNEFRDVPNIHGWLRNLKPGLHLTEIPHSVDERQNHFVQLCCQAFTARPPANIRRRQQIFAMYNQDPAVWEAVTQELKSEHVLFCMDIAGWIDELTQKPIRPVPLGSTDTPAIAVEEPAFDWVWQCVLLGSAVIVLMIHHIIDGERSKPSAPQQIPYKEDAAKLELDLIEYLERRQKATTDAERGNDAFGRLMGIPANATPAQEATILKNLKKKAKRSATQ